MSLQRRLLLLAGGLALTLGTTPKGLPIKLPGGLVDGFRPPCTPLNVVSPFQSVWSCSDTLYGGVTKHWDGVEVGLVGILRVDGVSYRFMGMSQDVQKTVQQTQLSVYPATTMYYFEAGGVSLCVQFGSPAVNLDGDLLNASRPVTHMIFIVAALDGKDHDVQLYYDNTAEGAVSKPDEEVSFKRPKSDAGITVLQVGTTSQETLSSTSDRISWGYWYVSTPAEDSGLHTLLASASDSHKAFANGTYFKMADSLPSSLPANQSSPVMSVAWDLGSVMMPTIRRLTLAYDQVDSIKYFGTPMPPLWRTVWTDGVAMLEATERRYMDDISAIGDFDNTLVPKLADRGGEKFATLASLIYRQVVGGTQAVHNPLTGEQWVFMKEVSSGGDVSTVDVISPAFPLFQYLYPEYFRKILVPHLVYSNNETKKYGLDVEYNLPWAPHHLGNWPICQLRAKQQEQMPMEESGNMLILLTALFEIQKDISYLKNYWPVLDGWADYLLSTLPDPGKQLCTDDFEGPSPHNVNLAAKGIVGLFAYSRMVEARGDRAKAQHYVDKAKVFLGNWTSMASDGDHYRRQFDLPGSWSMKYNLQWQRALGLTGGFPEDVFSKEAAFYETKLQPCGIPMDDRHPFTMTVYASWTSVLGSRKQFDIIWDRLFLYANTTTGRVPLSDWFDATNCNVKGFRARPVQGALFSPMLTKIEEARPVYV